MDSNAQTVTLEVTPGDAEKLAVAKEIGTLQLALRPARNPDPGEPPAPKGITTRKRRPISTPRVRMPRRVA